MFPSQSIYHAALPIWQLFARCSSLLAVKARSKKLTSNEGVRDAHNLYNSVLHKLLPNYPGGGQTLPSAACTMDSLHDHNEAFRLSVLLYTTSVATVTSPFPHHTFHSYCEVRCVIWQCLSLLCSSSGRVKMGAAIRSQLISHYITGTCARVSLSLCANVRTHVSAKGCVQRTI